MKNPEQFPILESDLAEGCPKTVPWDMIAPFEARAIKNHDRTFQALAMRGGLSPVELYWVMTGRDIVWLKELQYKMLQALAVDFLNEQLIIYQNKQAAESNPCKLTN